MVVFHKLPLPASPASWEEAEDYGRVPAAHRATLIWLIASPICAAITASNLALNNWMSFSTETHFLEPTARPFSPPCRISSRASPIADRFISAILSKTRGITGFQDSFRTIGASTPD